LIGFLPTIDPEVWQRYPEYCALSVVVRDFRPEPGAPIPAIPLEPPAWLMDHMEAWRAAFRAFGANPKKTPCSVEALWKRVQKNGSLPSIDPVVDLYNALSIRFGACFGGEDLDRYAGSPRLVVARGDEPFDTVRDGVPVVEHPEIGEIVWRDDRGVTCRRWNWRQCKRTALNEDSRNLWFVIDRLPPMPIEELLRAGNELVAGLARISPSITHSVDLLEPAPHPSGWERV
jgi:DNA/RNA-binding domain of Phe-tRNA-synthetase-like protein